MMSHTAHSIDCVCALADIFITFPKWLSGRPREGRPGSCTWGGAGGPYRIGWKPKHQFKDSAVIIPTLRLRTHAHNTVFAATRCGVRQRPDASEGHVWCPDPETASLRRHSPS